ncbi:unnamed protein product [Vitrella brassicaformis CCMP3155]|uniref:AP2/ERF domain-containing protein n=1 Tax=Vitrella brassicaformis (strain CCMP3155) TaxID=1169540 RepID=A0A0G4FDB3_VITBC|nr:unnamed protein product [Vitrella brassicaformis CCMP3155]|eukprot:CEM11172.1 unnamed protein product [Vitrella brassicaformis CCMP3155]
MLKKVYSSNEVVLLCHKPAPTPSVIPKDQKYLDSHEHGDDHNGPAAHQHKRQSKKTSGESVKKAIVKKEGDPKNKRPVPKKAAAEGRPHQQQLEVPTSKVNGVYWRGDVQAWVASWYEREGHKQLRKFKRFNVKEHGFPKAKALAEEHRRRMDRIAQTGVAKHSEHKSGVRGVHFNQKDNSWVATLEKGRMKKTKAFPVLQFCYEGAKQAAIAHRQAMEGL